MSSGAPTFSRSMYAIAFSPDFSRTFRVKNLTPLEELSEASALRSACHFGAARVQDPKKSNTTTLPLRSASLMCEPVATPSMPRPTTRSKSGATMGSGGLGGAIGAGLDAVCPGCELGFGFAAGFAMLVLRGAGGGAVRRSSAKPAGSDNRIAAGVREGVSDDSMMTPERSSMISPLPPGITVTMRRGKRSVEAMYQRSVRLGWRVMMTASHSTPSTVSDVPMRAVALSSVGTIGMGLRNSSWRSSLHPCVILFRTAGSSVGRSISFLPVWSSHSIVPDWKEASICA